VNTVGNEILTPVRRTAVGENAARPVGVNRLALESRNLLRSPEDARLRERG